MEKVRLLILVLAVPALINGENDDKQINENAPSEVDPRWKMHLLNRFEEVGQVNWPQRHQQSAFFGERPRLIELPHNWQQHQQQQDANRNEFQGTFNDIEALNQFNEIRQPNDFKHQQPEFKLEPEFKFQPEFQPEMKPERLQRPLQGISTSILVPLIPVHIDPMGNTVRLPATFQRQERQSNLVNDRTIVPPHLRFQKVHHHQENDNRFEEQRNVENQHQQRPGQFQQVQVPVFVPQNKNQKLEENFIGKPQQQFRPPFNAFPPQQNNNNRFHNGPNEQRVNLIQQNENQNDGRQNRNFRQAKEQVPNVQSENNMLTRPTDPNNMQNNQRPFSKPMASQNQDLPANDHPLQPTRDLTGVPIPQILDFPDNNNAQNLPGRDLLNKPNFPPRDASMFPSKNGPNDPSEDATSRSPFPSRDVANGPAFSLFPQKNGPNNKPFPSRDETNGRPSFPSRSMTKGPPFPLRDEPNGNLFPHRDVMHNGATSPPLSTTALTDKPFPLRESGNDASFQFREPPNGQFEREQGPNNNRPPFQFFNQNLERMPNQNPERMPNQNPERMPNQNPERMPNQIPERMPKQNSERMPNQNQQQRPNLDQQLFNQNQQHPNQNQQHPNQNQQHPNQNQRIPNQNQQQQMPFMNHQQQQFANNNQQPPQLQNQNRQLHQLPFNNQRPLHPKMMQQFPNQNRPFFHPNNNRDPNFDRHFNSMRPDFNNFPPFSKDEMSLPEISNALTSVMPNNNNGPMHRPPFEFSQGPPRPPFTGPPPMFRPPQGPPQMTQTKNVEVPKIFGDFPSEPKFDRSPWIPVTPLPKIARKHVASSSREALRVENPPTNSFSTTLPSSSTITGIGEQFEALPPTSTPGSRFQSTTMTPISTLMSLTTVASPLSVDRSPKIDVISANETDLDSNKTLDEHFNRLRRLPEFFEHKPIETRTVEPDFTTPTLFFPPPSNNNIDSTPWTNEEPFTDVPIASSLSITESSDFPSTTPTQEMSANLRQIGVEQLYRHWKSQFAQNKVNEQEPASTTELAFNFTQPQTTFAEPQTTFTQPQTTFTQSQTTFTQPQTTFPEPQLRFTGNRGIVNEHLQALDLRPSDWSQRTSPKPAEVTSIQPPQIQTPDIYGRREENPSNSPEYFSTTTEQYPQLLSSESVVTPSYATAYTATTPKKRVKSFTQKVLVRRRKIVKAKVARTRDVTVNQIEYSTPPTF